MQTIYRCDFCWTILLSRDECREHEKNCIRNFQSKSCPTCRFSGIEMKNMGAPFVCEKNMLPNRSLACRSHCEEWKADSDMYENHPVCLKCSYFEPYYHPGDYSGPAEYPDPDHPKPRNKHNCIKFLCSPDNCPYKKDLERYEKKEAKMGIAVKRSDGGTDIVLGVTDPGTAKMISDCN